LDENVRPAVLTDAARARSRFRSRRTSVSLDILPSDDASTGHCHRVANLTDQRTEDLYTVFALHYGAFAFFSPRVIFLIRRVDQGVVLLILLHEFSHSATKSPKLLDDIQYITLSATATET